MYNLKMTISLKCALIIYLLQSLKECTSFTTFTFINRKIVCVLHHATCKPNEIAISLAKNKEELANTCLENTKLQIEVIGRITKSN